MKPLDYLAPLAVVASMVALGLSPSAVYLGAFITAVAFYAGERVAQAYRANAERQHEHSLVVVKYGVEVEELRKEIKVAVDGVKTLASNATMAKRATF